MGNFWLKFRLWFKAILFSAIAFYVVLFLAQNWYHVVDRVVIPFWAQYKEPRLLTVLLMTALVTLIGWWLIKTVFRTIRQVREVRERNRNNRLEREIAEMRAKADRLQTREPAAPASAAPQPAPEPPKAAE